ncbi:transposase [Orenia metallireducens]|uniref:Transposase n=1 Tax=Orenia metallireducens TaxID=1413210 RepID=A0A1C0A8I9_9FIRM|nr:transposase [Orenia metallireducens]OCL26531.1 transposase [Orenia metallireducens]
MGSTGKKYTEDFKQMIVELYQSGKSKSKLASEYGVSRISIDNWIELYTEIEVDENTSVTYKELLAIKKENQRLKQEAEILKKTLTIFAQK